jgi:hypothetical protein
MRLRFTSLVVSALATAVIAGCGGSSSNGVESKSANGIVQAATQAISGVKTVHVAGSVRNNGTPITLNLYLVANKGGRGTMSQNGLSFQIIQINNKVYISGSQAFWEHQGNKAVASLLEGKWLETPATGDFASLAELTDVNKLFNAMLSTHGTLAKGQPATVNGQKVIAVTDTTKGGTLYVATTGNAYPIQVTKPGTNGGTVNFDQFNQSVSLSAPANSLNLQQLESG